MRIVISTKPRTAEAPLTVTPACVRITARPLRILDFDIENRPLTYLGSDFTTAEVTAISWAWSDQPEDVTVYLLGEAELPDILRAFCAAYEQADVVTGHFILGHDLPMINGALMEFGMPALSDKLVSDTKVHLLRAKGLSKSQESLGAMFHLDHDKVQMNQFKWRAANRLTPEGLNYVRERVAGDVRQHIALRAKLLEGGYLSGPRLWKSGTARIDPYQP